MTDDKVIFINPTFEDLCRLHPELIDWRNSYIAACERADRAESQVAALTAELLASTQRMTAQSKELNAEHKTIQACLADLDAAQQVIKSMLLHWDNTSPRNVQFDKLTDCVRELRTVYAAPQAAQAQIDEIELLHICGKCGAALQLVRPGKWQCVNCEAKE